MSNFLPNIGKHDMQTPTLAKSLKKFNKDWVDGGWQMEISLKDYIDLRMRYPSLEGNRLYNNNHRREIDNDILSTMFPKEDEGMLTTSSIGGYGQARINNCPFKWRTCKYLRQ
jgi:hypothetical protein